MDDERCEKESDGQGRGCRKPVGQNAPHNLPYSQLQNRLLGIKPDGSIAAFSLDLECPAVATTQRGLTKRMTADRAFRNAHFASRPRHPNKYCSSAIRT
jgi:hypothetical protein